MPQGHKKLVGAIELCDLPELEISQLNVRVDTGAATSSLHVDNIEEFEKNNEQWIRFDIHPDIHNVERVVRREAPIVGKKQVKSSTATREKRYVIDTPIVMDDMRWTIQLTLTDRSEMTYLMLLGREAMNGRLLVDPEFEFLLTGKD
ncbi:ATP-dependent zinc protease [Alteromonas sp. ASW11-19]|uniref:ATP-dependent zinc protease n=1 Tax=Alteromonas salexigens TaxID=2982530 RepID=A0ABT2VP12_9ALTE|nr:ATP-dependent zinc protease [Alteromonas salexigens]MCU7553679.1 ATP-dependent zinc protease [Alteromonas salexigens]